MQLANSLRSISPKETLERVKPYIKKANITRLANISHLDEMAIPTFSAIRPLALSLTVSQGKGLTEDEAKVSAYMESIEVYYAENVQADILNQPYRCNPLFINPNDLSKQVIYGDNHLFNWCQVESLLSHQPYYIPIEFLSIDTTDKNVLLQGSDTTGLASGNNRKEALIHSFFECIERLNIKNNPISVIIDINHSTYQLLAKNHHIKLFYYENSLAIPTFGCFFQSNNCQDNQIIFSGYGCHFDKNIALNRAITEAIQAKLTLISGTRDDIDRFTYQTNAQTLPQSNKSICFSQLKDQKFKTINALYYQLIEILNANDLDLLVYSYHQQALCILKSILIQRDVLAL
ncbi:YcaO-like family protein [Thiotrichales bacterium 19S3-7]|nr:YcaO-like family protein [Thiotrichales bacterium 19S3-7]MCF6801625.1 YcaO-like family protein [Thiotrichales bacterium 19S3-11]